ncbi:MAG: hypothetical protein JRH10_12645 [Deltaproteobacteria bacterium]|nr:hypothetical protein [Deltaproteobacteria bacterium]MBW2445730.1 hypothetical protein [Deltaproteobacteria bacterium]
MRTRTFAALLAAFLVATPASAAPISGNVTVSITIQGLTPVTVGGSGIVDITGGVISVSAGLVSAPGPILVPVTGVTAVDSLSLVGFSNLSGVFSVGGITAQAPGEVCPGGVATGGALTGVACNLGGAVGGVMGLTGTLNVNIIPNIVVIPFNLAVVQLGQGGSLNSPFFIDAAGWTTGTGLLNTGVNTHATTGFGTASGFQLVSPLFVAACGNLLPVFASFTMTGLTAVPEPAVWISIWLGLLGVVTLTRRK